MEAERGYTICANGKISRGPTAVGDRNSVNVPLICPRGSNVIGVFHTHPGGSTAPSPRDIASAKEKNLKFMCIKAKGKVKCYRQVHKS